MTVGQRIFELLKQKGMTQKEFSERTGIATTTISDWRKKNTNPGSDKILLICAALEVTPEYLLSGVSEDSHRIIECLTRETANESFVKVL